MMEENSKIDNLKKQIFSSKEIFSRLFIPVAKLSHNSPILKQFEEQKNTIVLQTTFGQVEIRNRLLTETHSRLLAEIIACGSLEQSGNGQVMVRFSESEILHNLKMGNKNHLHLRELIKQIGDARYYVGIRRSKPLKIIEDHSIEIFDGVQTIILTKEYVEANQIDFAIANSTLNEKMRSLKVSTIPTIVKVIYANSLGCSDYSIHLNQVLDQIGLITTKKSLETLRASLDEYTAILESDFYIKYLKSEKRFETTPEIENKLTFVRELVDDDIFAKYENIKFITEDVTHTIKSIKKNGFRDFSIETYEGSILHFQSFIDDFLYFLDELKDRKNKVDLSAISEIKKQPSLFD